MPVTAKMLEAEEVARVDPVVTGAILVAVEVAVRSATNVTKWDTSHVIARKIWIGATAVTAADTSHATAVCRRTTHAVTTAIKAATWLATARKRAIGT